MAATVECVETSDRATGAALFGHVERLIARGQLPVALDDLCVGLAGVRERLDDEEWSAFAREALADPIAALLHEDPLTRRAFLKPRGYAGDAVMMDYIYGAGRDADPSTQPSRLGRQLLACMRNRPAGLGVRCRRDHIAHLIDDLAVGTPRPRVLSIAAGHLREAECSSAVASGRVGRYVALDADAESLREVSARRGGTAVETIKASVRDLIARRVPLGRFDFVYAAGLFDYLSDPVAQALTARMFEMTSPGGRVLIPNFAPSCADRAYLETFMAWRLIYRDEFDMARLVAPLPASEIAGYDIYADPWGTIVYLLIRKA